MRTNALRKVGLVFLFGLGLFTMVAAVVRIISIFVVSTPQHIPNFPLLTFSYAHERQMS